MVQLLCLQNKVKQDGIAWIDSVTTSTQYRMIPRVSIPFY